jgi:hypothetical protein
VSQTDNEYVRRVGFALSLSDGPLVRRSNPFAWLAILAAASFAIIALLAS